MHKLPIYHVFFPTRHLLTSTFLRFQEHYESPRFRGKAFSWDEFMDWYASVKGKFSYLEDWSGFNIPDWVLVPFYQGKFDPLTRKERLLLDRFRGVTGRFYIIGTEQGETLDTVLHEIVHGLFYVFPAYGDAVTACLRAQNTKRLRAWLAKEGYAENTMDDEINAYLLTGLGKKMNGPEVPAMRQALSGVFREHFNGSIRSPSVRKRLYASVHKVRLAP